MPGFDPILDGTAATGTEFKVTVHDWTDGSRSYGVKFPDATSGFYETYEEMAHALANFMETPA